MDYLINHWQALALYFGLLIADIIAVIIVRLIINRLLYSVIKRRTTLIDKVMLQKATRPAGILLFFFFATLISFTPALPSYFPVIVIQRMTFASIIIALGWQLISLVSMGSEYISRQHSTDNIDNLEARKVTTQMVVLKRLLNTGIVVLTLAFVFMLFPAIRNLGAGLFASAGVIGLVAGMAARPTLGNLIAGLQIAFAQPIRIDDVVIVEGEWGWIEEIRTTYVVVKIWDLRRLVVPISYFIEKPFQNWTRQTADILGTVFIYTDYSIPVEQVREQLHQILKATPLWDGKVWNLQVTNTTEQTMELRALMSAPNSPQAWDLRCHVREALIAYLQHQYPKSLPKIRALMEADKKVP